LASINTCIYIKIIKFCLIAEELVGQLSTTRSLYGPDEPWWPYQVSAPLLIPSSIQFGHE
jgi:hypothetical protein